MTTTDTTAGAHARGPVVPLELQPPSGAPSVEPADLVTLGSRVSLRQYLADMWAYREFAATAPMAQVQAKSNETVLGKAWNLLNPLFLIAIYYLIFQVILGIESRRGVDDYLPFLTVGVITYNFIRTSTNGGSLSVVKGRRLMQSLYFPRALLPLSSTITQGLAHLWAIGALAILLPIMGVRPTPTLLLFPVAVLLTALMNFGLALIAARFTFHFRDFNNFLPYVLRVGMYVSGVLIPINSDMIGNSILLFVLRATPTFALIEVTRETLLGEPLDPVMWAVATAWSLGLLTVGFWYFRQAENEYGRV